MNTGNGVHAYWIFEQPYEIHNPTDCTYIEQLLKGWENYVHQFALAKHGWKFDAVADLPRMLRAPETTNFKTNDRPTCEVVSVSENYYKPSDFESFCKEKATSASSADDVDEFAMMGTGSAKELISKCIFLQNFKNDAANLSEPQWYAMITNLALTADGHEAVHKLSEPYLGYSYQETEKKYLHALKEDKPTKCEHIRNRLCFRCSKTCGVKAPIALVHSNTATAEPEWEEPIPFDNFTIP